MCNFLRRGGRLLGGVVCAVSYPTTGWFIKASRTLCHRHYWYEIYCGFNCFNWTHGNLIYCETESRSYLRYGFMIQHAHICPPNYPCMHFPLLFLFFPLLFAFLLLLCTHSTFSLLLLFFSSCTFIQVCLFVSLYLFPSFYPRFFLPLMICSHSGQQEHKGAGLC